MARYYCNSVVRGYHIYKDVWDATRGEMLDCTRETGNAFDPFAVSVQKRGNIVGHVPRKISAICALFIRRGGTIQCKVTGSRQYSRDISQGGLEIPCMLIFTGDPKDIQKVKKTMSFAGEKVKAKPSKETDQSKDGGVVVKKEPAK